MFCDEIAVTFTAGSGGKGCVSFRREKYVARGGPDGGDGGKGGDIFLQANANINTLAEFNTKKIFYAGHGETGKGKKMAGADAENLILQVPVGTMIFDEKKKLLLGDLQKSGDKFLVSRGGKGGFGNSHFASSVRQAPGFAELGEPGEHKICVLELKLVADVGFIGIPSVGKSTLLARISNARPKIADYPFTTLIPNLGLVTLQKFGGSLQQNFLACDMPGLIEDAHKGKGLGIRFLKHVMRNRVLVHLLDANSEDVSRDYKIIIKELRKFDATLAKKPQIVAFNKIDTVSAAAVKSLIAMFKKKNRSIKKIHAISCVRGDGIKELVFAIWNLLQHETVAPLKKLARKKSEYKIFRPALEKDFHAFDVKLLHSGSRANTFSVTGGRIEQIVVMTDFSNPEAVARVYDVFEKMKIDKELRLAGARYGDKIKIREHELIYRWKQ